MKGDLLILCVFLCIGRSYQFCIWDSQCLPDLVTAKIRNHFTDGSDPQPLLGSDYEEGMSILRERCPIFLEKYEALGLENQFCCDLSMIKTMRNSMDLAAGIFQRCQTCTLNLYEIICEFNCSPNNTNFMEAKELITDEISGKECISDVNIFLNKDYQEGVYSSCKGVVVPDTGGSAMDAVCGPYGASQCNAERLFESLGDESSPLIAFQMNYLNEAPEGKTVLVLDTKPCDESYQNMSVCTCTDCEANCPGPLNYPEEVKEFNSKT